MRPTSEARLRATPRTSRDATLVFDRDGAIRFAAAAAEELFGQRAEELATRRVWDLVHPEDLAAGLAEIARCFDRHEAATVEWRVRDARGTWRWVEQAMTDLSRSPAVEGVLAQLRDVGDRRALVARLEMEEDLRRALQSGELEVHYQPVVRLDGRLAGAEALVRWNHPRRGLVNPAEFVPVAEETGLVSELGAQVLDAACTTVARWRDELDPDLFVSVNLSVRQLTECNLPRVVAAILARSGLEPGALCLELTETALMHDAVAAGATLDELLSLGVSLAVDDFGTGYSSLLYLRRFPCRR